MTIESVITVLENSKDDYDILSNAFTFGYLQGMKAQKAKDRKKKA